MVIEPRQPLLTICEMAAHHRVTERTVWRQIAWRMETPSSTIAERLQFLDSRRGPGAPEAAAHGA